MTKLRVEKRRCWEEQFDAAAGIGAFAGERWGFADGYYFYTFPSFKSALFYATREDLRYSNATVYFLDQTDRVAGRAEHSSHVVDSKLCKRWR